MQDVDRVIGSSGERPLTFEQVYEQYQVKIFNLIYRQVGDYHDAEDLTLLTFENAYRAWDRFRGEAQASTWLYQIAINNCRNYFRKRSRQRDREAVSLDDSIETDSGELTREVADWREAPERVLLDKEFSGKLQEAVNSLAPMYREVLVLCVMDGLSYEDAAQVLGETVAAVKTRLHRARLKVRTKLEPYYQGWMGGRIDEEPKAGGQR